MSIGTFGSFTQARLAIYASQTGLTVTGNNISNINTKGYTRQRLDQKSMYNGAADRYYATTGVRVGQGVLCYGLSQLRDPYLDIQYRTKSAEVGAMDALLDGLNRISSVLDEVGKGGEIPEGKEFGILVAQFRQVYKALNSLTDQTGHNEYDAQVRSACETLTNFIRSYSRGLEEKYDDTVRMLKDDVSDVNTILTSIRNLNENIRQADLYGDDALEMRDDRNVLIDQLSEYLDIDVTYSMEKAGVGAEVEKLTIKLGNANPDTSVHTDETTLIDGIYAAQLSIDAVLNPKAYKYMEPDGTLTNNEARAEQAPMENPNFGKTPGVDTMDGDYPGPGVRYVKLSADGKTYEAALNAADADQVPKENPDYDQTGANDGLLYLKEDGTATATYEEAASHPNYNITVSELKDRNGRLLFTIGKPTETPSTEAEFNATGGKATTEVDPATGITTITTYLKKLSDDISRNPRWNKGSTTAYPYLTSSGTGTSDAQQAAKVYQYNPNFNKDPADADWDKDSLQDPNAKYIKVNQATMKPFDPPQGTNDYNEAWVPKENNAYKADDITGYRYIKYASKDKDPATLTIADYTNNLSEARGEPTYVKQVYQKIPSMQVKLDDNDLYGKIQSRRELLTEAGEFASQDTVANIDENAVTKRGIPYYQKSLDLLAHTFATEMNKANQGYITNASGELVTQVWDPTANDGAGAMGSQAITLEGGYTLKKTDMLSSKEWDMSKVPQATKDWLEDKNYVDADGNADVIAYLNSTQTVKYKGDPTKEYKDADGNAVSVKAGTFLGGNLFSNNGDSNSDDPPITAGNISVSLGWASGPLIVNSFICPEGFTEPASSDSDNIVNNLTSLFYRSLEFHPDTVPYEGVTNVRHDAMFTGSIEDMWLNTTTILGQDSEIASKELDSAYNSQVNIDISRDSVSAVDFNDEAMNLMMYAKAYNAACRMMTTLDSVLDKLINNTGMTT